MGIIDSINSVFGIGGEKKPAASDASNLQKKEEQEAPNNKEKTKSIFENGYVSQWRLLKQVRGEPYHYQKSRFPKEMKEIEEEFFPKEKYNYMHSRQDILFMSDKMGRMSMSSGINANKRTAMAEYSKELKELLNN